MKTATLSDVTQEEFDDAVQKVVSAVKANDPKLDTRLGTVMRELLVNPEARIEATVSKQLEFARQATSLKLMQSAESSGEEVDADDVNAILSNFNVSSASGTYSDGVVKISVTDGTHSYTVRSGTRFTTIDGVEFTATSTVVAAADGIRAVVAANAKLYEGTSTFFLLVPVRASAVGSSGNIRQGTSLTMGSSLYTFVSAEAYRTFSGGSDVADLSETIRKIPTGLSIRGFVNKTACESMLRDNFDAGDHPILDCSVVGYGHAAQRRDKHNLFGVGVGGRIDLYVRNFSTPFTETATFEGTRRYVTDASGSVESVSYDVEIPSSAFPGAYWIKSVGCEGSVLSTLSFTCRRTASASSTWHDIDVSKTSAEAFGTVWQGFSLSVDEVPEDDGSSDEWPETREFTVTAYCLPQASELQAYVDGDGVRSVSTDVVVRCPLLCCVTVSATAYYDVDSPVDADEAAEKIRQYINSRRFGCSLTRSEIVHVLKLCGVTSVDLSRKDMLSGVVYDAYGDAHELSGDALRLDGVADDGAMLTSDTAVFVVEPENIRLTLVANE